MENRRRQKSNAYRGNISGRRSRYEKQPRGSWQPSVPSWEKTFCKVIGSLDWETLLEMKKFVYLYDNIIKWNDSAGEEAFRSAKNRFWAKIHGLPCDSELPDPDLYIDEIDWDSEIDAELLADLDCQHAVPDAVEKSEGVVVFGDSLMTNLSFSPSGWGESEENFKRAADLSNKNNDNLNPWECNCNKSNIAAKEYGYGVGWNNSGLVNRDNNQKVRL